MSGRRRYKNPPIEEALCELRFRPGQDWNLTIPGKLQTQLGDEYTGKPQEQRGVQVGLESQGGEPSNLRYGEGLGRVLLVTKDDKRKIGVGQDVLSVHMLRPYQTPNTYGDAGWEEFRPRILQALTAYWGVAEPVGVCRVGIRYINKIIVPKEKRNIQDYLKCAFSTVTELPEKMNGFTSRTEFSYEDEVRLVLSQFTMLSPTNHIELILDLDVIWQTEDIVAQDEALKKIDDLRDRERAAFEAVITDQAREIFDAG